MTLKKVWLQFRNAGARRCLIIVNMLNRNNYYSVKNFLKKVLD